MNATGEKSEALRLLEGIESGRLPTINAVALAEKLDPVLVYAVVEYLRAIHRASDPAATPVLDRVVQLLHASPTLVRIHGEGERDPISRWFESEYGYRDFRGRASELIDLLVDKIES